MAHAFHYMPEATEGAEDEMSSKFGLVSMDVPTVCPECSAPFLNVRICDGTISSFTCTECCAYVSMEELSEAAEKGRKK